VKKLYLDSADRLTPAAAVHSSASSRRERNILCPREQFAALPRRGFRTLASCSLASSSDETR